MKVPYQKYIEVLLIGRMFPTKIANELENILGVTLPPKDSMNIIAKELKDSNTEYFKDKEVSPDLSWLDDRGVIKMYGYKFNVHVGDISGIDGAFKLLNDRQMYRLMTSLALANVTPEDIELIINGKYDIEYSSEDVDAFLFYFFNVYDWTYKEKVDFVNKVEDKNLQHFYKVALQGDKAYLMWKLGVAPNKSFDNMLRDMFVDSYYNFKEYSSRNPDSAQKWGTLAIRVSERLDKIEKEDKDKQDLYDDVKFILKSEVTQEAEEDSSIGGPFEPVKKYKKNEAQSKIKKLEDLN